jgi:DNA-binding transcriptional ArsR family regulator
MLNPLAEVAGWAIEAAPGPEPPHTPRPDSFDIGAFIAKHGLNVRREGPWNGGGRKWELDECPFNPEHTGGSAVIIQGADGKLGFKCLHNGCADRHWRDLRELFEPYAQRKGQAAAASPSNALPHLVSATELYNGELVRLRPLMEGLIWDGLTMIVAKPKAGKSWLMLQCAVQIAGGPGVEGVTALDHGPVLYGAFEEPAARTMARLRKLAPAGDWAENLKFVYDLLPLMGGGAEQLSALMEQLRPRLVVLDTLTALIKGGGKRENDVFRSQYAEVSVVRKLAEDFHTAFVLVHHARKGMADTAIESVAGTGGIAAAVDTLWCLKRKPEGEATLEVIGREAEEKTYALRFDQEPFGWRVLGDDAAQLLNAERRQVLELLREDGGLSPAQIAAELAKSRPAVRMLLKRMREAGQVTKQGSKYISSLSMSYRVTERDKENE